MLTQDEAQRILDHFKIGKINSFEYWVNYYEAETNQGTFYIIEIEDNPLKREVNEKEKLDQLKEKKLNFQRLLLPDYQGENRLYSSFVHQNDKYYSVYKLVRK